MAPAPTPSPARSPHPAAQPEPVRDPPLGAVPTLSDARYAPQDECAPLPGWPAFQRRLDHAIARRNAAEFAELAAVDVTLDYGGGQGRDELAKRLNDPARGPALWADLARIRTMGCTRKDGLIAMPWFFWNLPETIDPGMSMLATGPQVPVKARASLSAPTVATLDWAVVTLLPGFDPSAPFVHVETTTGEKGYVETGLLRSVLARRMIAQDRDGGWEVTALVAGD